MGITDDLDEQTQNALQDMLSSAYVFVDFDDRDVEAVYIYASNKDNLLNFKFFFRILGCIYEPKNLGKVFKAMDTSASRADECLNEGVSFWKQYVELCEETGQDAPSEVRMIYDTQSKELEYDPSWEVQGIASEQAYADWMVQEKERFSKAVTRLTDREFNEKFDIATDKMLRAAFDILSPNAVAELRQIFIYLNNTSQEKTYTVFYRIEDELHSAEELMQIYPDLGIDEALIEKSISFAQAAWVEALDAHKQARKSKPSQLKLIYDVFDEELYFDVSRNIVNTKNPYELFAAWLEPEKAG